MTMPLQRPGRSRQNYGTPASFIRAVTRRFGPLRCDLAASPGNAVVPDFFARQDDSLSQDWHTIGGLLWLNPPFENIEPWARKCQDESGKGARVLLLVPASTGSGWFQRWVHGQARIYLLCGRLIFCEAAGNYPKDCVLALYSADVEPGYETWDWRKEVW